MRLLSVIRLASRRSSALHSSDFVLVGKPSDRRNLSIMTNYGRFSSCQKTVTRSHPACRWILKHESIKFSVVVGRMFSSLSDQDVKRAIESLTDQFMEARELLNDARESDGTVYFSEDMEEAQHAVRETIKLYSTLLSQLSDKQHQEVVRTIGLKMEELKAQLQAMEQDLKEQH